MMLLAMTFVLASASSAVADAIHDAAAKGDVDEVRKLLKANPELATVKDGTWHRTPLHFAARNNCLAVVRFLLAQNVDIEAADDTGRTPLSLAVGNDKTEAALLSMSKGANVNTARTDTQYKGRTPLHDAASNGNQLLVERLIEKGADVSAKARGDCTVLHCAFDSPSQRLSDAKLKSLITLLIDKGADVDAQSEYGTSPLQLAVERGVVNVVQLLLDRHANVSPKTPSGATPYGTASKAGKTRIMQLLKDHGASE